MAAATISRSLSSARSRLILNHLLAKPSKTLPLYFSRKITTFPHNPNRSWHGITSRTVYELQEEVAREFEMRREERRKAGLDTADIDAEEQGDYMGVQPLIDRLRAKKVDHERLMQREEPTDSDSEEFDEFNSWNAIIRDGKLQVKKAQRLQELMNSYLDSERLEDAFKRMEKVKKFERKHFFFAPEYKVFGDLLNRLKDATGKDKFLLQIKLNRAVKLLEWKYRFDPNNPANYGVIKRHKSDPDPSDEHDASEKGKQSTQGQDEEVEDEFDDVKEKNAMFTQQIEDIDRKLEEKLADLDHTFGRKGKLLEEEIRTLAEERNALTEKKRMPLYRKGFKSQIIKVNRTSKVTKGGRVVRYTALVVCGNGHGAAGFAKAKGETVPAAMTKAVEKSFQNLHYFELYEGHTIPTAIQATYKRTKIYLWPARTRTTIIAGKIVKPILMLAGYIDVKSKIIGSRNPHNTVKALFKALNAIETPRDIQQKFGRTVVDKNFM